MNILSFRWLFVALLLTGSTPLYAQHKLPANFRLFFEKAFLHTDREAFAAGDTLWYKAYLTDAQTGILTTSSTNLYVELISPADSLVSRQTVLLQGGASKGDITLPDLLASGNYRLRAYTNWMHNFDDLFLFEKNITVVSKIAAAPLPTAGKISVKQGKLTGLPAVSTPHLTLRFFPEGGAMVQQLTGLVAVKAENSTGAGTALKGAIVALPSNDTVSHFTCDSTGMGLFTLMPLKGQHYQAVYNYQNTPANTPLPAALTQGPVLKVYRNDTAWIADISINAQLAGNPTNFKLSIKHAGKIYIQQDIMIDREGHQRITIPHKLLPAGIVSLTLQDGTGRPYCERLIYSELLVPARLRVQTDQGAYTAHQKTVITVQALSAGGKPVKANLSVAVVDAKVIPVDESNIGAYLMLQSELKGKIEHPGRYFDTTNVNRLKQLDLLLLTQGWRNYIWRHLADTAINLTYAPEQGLVLQGRVVSDNRSNALPGANITLYAEQAKGTKLFAAQTDSSGRYHFNNLIQYGKGTVTLTARNTKGQYAGKIIADTSYYVLPVKNYPASPFMQVDEPHAYEALVQRQPTKAVKDTLKLKAVKVRANKNITLRDITVTSFGYPDEVLVPGPKDDPARSIKNYILFASKQAKMQNEAEANAGMMLAGSAQPDKIISDRLAFFAEGKLHAPRLIVNGYEVPVESAEEIVKNDLYDRYLNIPLSKAEKVVIKRMIAPPTLKRARGEGAEFLNISGGVTSNVTKIDSEPIFIIYLTLKPGALDAEEKNLVHGQLNGYYQAREFYQPVYDKAAAAKPYIRTTIYWVPMLQTNALGQGSLSYYNADNTGAVRIIIQGVTDTGIPLFAISNYVVK